MSTSTGTVCAICQSAIEANEPREKCPTCASPYHAECWQENGGCAVYGCAGVPRTESRSGLEIPVSYWGQEKKPCPVCGALIQAAALRCRECGTTFKDARPQGTNEFVRQSGRDVRVQGLKSKSILILVLCLIPVTAVVGLIIGVPWYLSNRADIEVMPGGHKACVKIGLAAGVFQVVFILVVAVIASVVG